MKLLPLRPTHLHQGADLDWSLSDSYFTTQDRRFLQGARSDNAQAALAHIVNTPGNRAGPGLSGADIGEGGNGHLKVLGEPGLLASIAFGHCPHGKPSWRDGSRKYILQMA
jgi:hypothetical protein